MRWRRVEVDRLSRGRWELCWTREYDGGTEEMRVAGPPREIARALPTLLRFRFRGSR